MSNVVSSSSSEAASSDSSTPTSDNEVKVTKTDVTDYAFVSNPTPPPTPPPIEQEVAKLELPKVVESEPIQNQQQQQSEDETINHDGNYYLKLLDHSTEIISQLCKEYEIYVDAENEQTRVENEEIQGQIQAAIGKGRLLINQKLKQFRGLCEKNIRDKVDTSYLKEGDFVTLDEDLAGFWDMVSIQVDDIKTMFDKLNTLRNNGWKLEPKQVIIKKQQTSSINTNSSSSSSSRNKTVTAASTRTTTTTTTKGSEQKQPAATIVTKQTAASKARAEAAKQRLLEAKRNAALLKQKESLAESTLNNEPEVVSILDSATI